MTEQEYKDRLKRLIDLLPMNNASSVNNYWKVKEWADEGFNTVSRETIPRRMRAANEIYKAYIIYEKLRERREAYMRHI